MACPGSNQLPGERFPGTDMMGRPWGTCRACGFSYVLRVSGKVHTHADHTPRPSTEAPQWVGSPQAVAPSTQRHSEKLPGAE